MLNTATKRTTVTVDDRRAVFMAVRGRKPRDVAAVPNEQFIRNMLKDRLGWRRREPAPESVKAVTREMVAGMKKAAADAFVKKAAEPTLATAA